MILRYTILGAKQVLTIEEVSLLTGFSKSTVYRMTSEREIPHFKRGAKLFFNKSEIEEWLQQERVLSRDEIIRSAQLKDLERRKLHEYLDRKEDRLISVPAEIFFEFCDSHTHRVAVCNKAIEYVLYRTYEEVGDLYKTCKELGIAIEANTAMEFIKRGQNTYKERKGKVDFSVSISKLLDFIDNIKTTEECICSCSI